VEVRRLNLNPESRRSSNKGVVRPSAPSTNSRPNPKQIRALSRAPA
jgi:hypothetical protein